MEKVDDPDKVGYIPGGTTLLAPDATGTAPTAPASPASYVTVVDGKVTGVILTNGSGSGTMSIDVHATPAIGTTAAVPFSINNITRDSVTVH